MKYYLAGILVLLLSAALARNVAAQEKQTEAPDELAVDISRATRWVEAAPVQTVPPHGLGATLRPQDLITYVSPGVLFPARNIGLQCQGINATLADVPQRMATARTTVGSVEPRFGEVVLHGMRAFRLQMNAVDVLPNGVSPRCELIAYPMPGSALPQGQNFWLAFSFWADDWAGTADEQLIAQMHVQEPRNTLLNPFVALVVRGGELRLEVRYSKATPPDKASTHLMTAARMAMPVRQWTTAVIQARISTQASQAPFLRMWLNGRLVADYAGPLGYILPTGGFSYHKVGVYHWIDDNPWDLKVPVRALLVRTVMSVLDTDGRYSHDLLEASVTHDIRR